MKVAIYIRVSTRDKQDISKQRDYLLAHAERNGWEVHKVYQDRGISGSKQRRPALDDLLKEIDDVDGVLVYKLDRLGRSFKHLFGLFEFFEKKGVEFISATQNIDTTTPGGKLFFHLLGAFAEFERDLTIQRINDGLAAAKARGKKLGRPKGARDRKQRRKIGYYQRWERT